MPSDFKYSASRYSKPFCAGRYGTYKLVQKQPGGGKLVAFTRILHRQKGDVLVDEVGVESGCASSVGLIARRPQAGIGRMRESGGGNGTND